MGVAPPEAHSMQMVGNSNPQSIQTPLHVFSQCFLVNKSVFRYIVLFGNYMDPLEKYM